jgi:hypothetical protein
MKVEKRVESESLCECGKVVEERLCEKGRVKEKKRMRGKKDV